jgi:hypothetical protein
MTGCLISGLPADALLDAEIWRYDLVLGSPASADGTTPAQPFDLTGSDLTIVFRTVLLWAPVSTLSTIATWPGLDGTITITNAAAGAVSIASDPWLRTYRVPALSSGRGVFKVDVVGDVLRLAQNDAQARPEYLGSINFPLRASTTQWAPPSSP